MDDNAVLERMVDQYGIQVVLMALSNICYEKAEFIKEAWQDQHLAGTWSAAGSQIEKLASQHWPV